MICAIVLAAGESRRMGAQKLLLLFAGQTVIGHVVDQALGTGDLRSERWHGRETGPQPSETGPQQRDDIHGAPISQVLVVVSEQGDEIRLALAGKPVTFLANPDPASDMLNSVRCGLRALPAGCTGVLVVLGDQPAIQLQLIRDIVRTFETTASLSENRLRRGGQSPFVPPINAAMVPAQKGTVPDGFRRIVVPVYNGLRGHPILFSADYAAELLTNHDGIGLRGLLKAHADEIHLVDVADPAVLSDIDYPEDYRRELARLLDAERK
jgi:molybdenum cofactor cytidylyltransferase